MNDASTGAIIFQVKPDEWYWGYEFGDALNGDPAVEPSTGILKVFDYPTAYITDFTLFKAQILVPGSLADGKTRSYSVSALTSARLELTDVETYSPDVYHEIYRPGAPPTQPPPP